MTEWARKVTISTSIAAPMTAWARKVTISTSIATYRVKLVRKNNYFNQHSNQHGSIGEKNNFNRHHHHHPFIIIYPLTVRVVVAPQMISQPVFHIFSVLHCPLEPGELQACSFPDAVFSSLLLCALSSTPFHCALQDGFGQTRKTGDMTTPLQFESLYDGQEVFVVYCGSTSFPWLVFFFGALF